MNRMYLSPGSVISWSAALTTWIDSLAGDSNFTPTAVFSGGNSSESYLAMMSLALPNFGPTLSVVIFCSDGHIPPGPAGFVPQTVEKPNRTWFSSCPTTERTPSLRLFQAVLVGCGQMTLPVLPV